MSISVGNIVDALLALGGEAHAADIADYIVANGSPPFPKDPRASVRARLQENCSGYTAYLGKQDLFASEAGSGVWRLRSWQYPEKDSEAKWLSEPSRDFNFDIAYPEGNRVLTQHYRVERNSTVVRQFKATLQEPRCEACRLDLSDIYGELASDYIEAHHRQMLSDADGDVTTSIYDLAALCPNCHRIIHKNYPMSVEELRCHLLQAAATWENVDTDVSGRLGWREAVRAAIKRMSARTKAASFSRQQLVDAELSNIVEDVGSKGITPAQTLSRILQELRDAGEIAFTDDKGLYEIKHLK